MKHKNFCAVPVSDLLSLKHDREQFPSSSHTKDEDFSSGNCARSFSGCEAGSSGNSINAAALDFVKLWSLARSMVIQGYGEESINSDQKACRSFAIVTVATSPLRFERYSAQ